MLPRKRPLIFTSMTEKKKKLLMDNVMKEERRCSECWSWKEVRGEVAKYLGCWYRHPRWHPVSTNNISSFFFPLLPLSRFLSLFLSYFLFLSRICLFLLLTLIRNIKNYYTISVFPSLIWYANCVIWYLRMV